VSPAINSPDRAKYFPESIELVLKARACLLFQETGDSAVGSNALDMSRRRERNEKTRAHRYIMLKNIAVRRGKRVKN
jgi:hypothetical protein